MWAILEKREESGDSWNGSQFERIQSIMVGRHSKREVKAGHILCIVWKQK